MVYESSCTAKKHLDPSPYLQINEYGSTREEEKYVNKIWNDGKWLIWLDKIIRNFLTFVLKIS